MSIQAWLRPGATAPPRPTIVPPPDLQIVPLKASSPDRIRLRYTARGIASLQHLSHYADGQFVRRVELSGTEVSQEIEVLHWTGARWLTAQVSDARGLLSAPQSIRITTAVQSPRRLYSVLVGNDIYANPQLRLEYASHDAERLSKMLAAIPDGYYSNSSTKLLTNKTATPDVIRAELTRVVEAAGPQDTVLLSFAGHGLQDKSGGYYLTPYGFDETRILETALAWRDVASVLRRAKARVIVILDACHAGLSGREGLGTNDDAVSALLAGDHPPMLVLAASKGRQFSYEDSKWDGGVFTYALIEVLKNRSNYDLNHNGVIEVSELLPGFAHRFGA